MKLFPDKKQNFRSWDNSPQVLSYQNFQIIKCCINGILLYLNVLLHIICVCAHACVFQVLSEETFHPDFKMFTLYLVLILGENRIKQL